MGLNRVAKGRRIERIAIEVLEADGYLVERCRRQVVRRPGQAPFQVGNDFFGCIDIIAKKAGCRTLWIQVTGKGSAAAKIQAMNAVPWNLVADQVEVWRWVTGKSIDGRTGLPRPTHYFQRYSLDDNFAKKPGFITEVQA